MGRRLFTIVSATSLLLCAGMFILAWRTRGVMYERFAFARWAGFGNGQRVQMIAHNGRILVESERGLYPQKMIEEYRRWMPGGFSHRLLHTGPMEGTDPLGLNHQRWNIGSTTASGPGFEETELYFLMPAWAYGVATLILPGLWIWQHWKHAGRLANSFHCTACGYDLRASPERCPECGEAVQERAVPRTRDRCA